MYVTPDKQKQHLAMLVYHQLVTLHIPVILYMTPLDVNYTVQDMVAIATGIIKRCQVNNQSYSPEKTVMLVMVIQYHDKVVDGSV